MKAAEALILTAKQAGIELCLANPGTTELPLVAALETIPGFRSVLGLFEGVCTGAADGYARMTGRPALTLLHHGAGLANGIANLHNARRARSPIVNLVGEHMTWHISADAPLTSDIAALARPVSAWVRTSASARSLPHDFAEALAAARTQGGHVATLIVPMDCQSGEAEGPVEIPEAAKELAPVSGEALESVRAIMKKSRRVALLLGTQALFRPGLLAAARISAATGCSIIAGTFLARLERGAGLPAVERVPYFPEQALARLAEFEFLILAGATEPVAFFGYPGLPSRLTPEHTRLAILARPEENAANALESLADSLGAPANGPVAPLVRPHCPSGPITPQSLGEAIASMQMEGLILVDEAVSSAHPYFQISAGAPPFTYLGNTGGSIGMGLPCATGAALACPDRRVLAFQADGSAMYTNQALWTQAREGLNVTTIICANRSYRILKIELARAGMQASGPASAGMTDLDRPVLDWVSLARGMGVPAVRVDTAQELAKQLGQSFSSPGSEFDRGYTINRAFRLSFSNDGSFTD